MSYNSEDLTIKQEKAIAALLGCQTAAKSRNSHGSARLGRLSTPPSSFF